MRSIDKIAKTLAEFMKKEKTSGYDTEATVVRVEGGTAWVHIPGGVTETPVKLTIDAEAGDSVQVRVAGGRAWITGNKTAPPTDDKVALQATKIINQTNQQLKEVQDSIDSIQGESQYFWHKETGSDAGAHITEITREAFEADPENGGTNLLAKSDIVAIRNGLTELATFGVNGAIVGQDINGQARSEIGPGGFQIYRKSNDTDIQIVNLGYGPVYDSQGHLVTAPYYSLGKRQTGSGIGMYSVAEGDNNIASAGNSHAEGSQCEARGIAAHAEGLGSIASGDYSHAEGRTTGSKPTTASGYVSHAEGYGTTASGDRSHSEGNQTEASGNNSHAEGSLSVASGDHSHAQNRGTVASKGAQTALGTFNIEDTDQSTTHPSGNANYGKYALIIGNGETVNKRSNALAVEWNGEVQIAIDTTAAAGTTDGDLYAAINALGWSGVIE